MKEEKYSKDLLVMQGNGGTVSSSIVSDEAVKTVMSGPASGVMAAAYTSMPVSYTHLRAHET